MDIGIHTLQKKKKKGQIPFSFDNLPALNDNVQISAEDAVENPPSFPANNVLPPISLPPIAEDAKDVVEDDKDVESFLKESDDDEAEDVRDLVRYSYEPPAKRFRRGITFTNCTNIHVHLKEQK